MSNNIPDSKVFLGILDEAYFLDKPHASITSDRFKGVTRVISNNSFMLLMSNLRRFPTHSYPTSKLRKVICSQCNIRRKMWLESDLPYMTSARKVHRNILLLTPSARAIVSAAECSLLPYEFSYRIPPYRREFS